MKTMLNIKTEKSLKTKAQKVARDLGLPLSAVLNQYLKEFVQEQRIVFQKPLVPNAKTRKILDEALKDIREGNIEDFSPVFHNSKDAIAWLNK